MKDGYAVIEEITISSSFESLNRVETLVENVCESLEINEENFGNVLIAVTEAVNNAIDHGNKQDPSKKVRICVGDKDSDFCFAVIDEGQGFNFENLPDPTAPENIEKEHGRGIFLMRSLAEEVDFEDEGREVTIYFSK
jgi:serine/threonine-protein kinase RsbW